MNKLVDEGEKNKKKISSAPQSLVEHFGLILERKTGYARGLGVKGVTSKSQEKSEIVAEAEAAKKRANDLLDVIANLNEVTSNQAEQIQAQKVALEKQAMELKQATTITSAIVAHLAASGTMSSMLVNALASTDSPAQGTIPSVVVNASASIDSPSAPSTSKFLVVCCSRSSIYGLGRKSPIPQSETLVLRIRLDKVVSAVVSEESAIGFISSGTDVFKLT
ncbi:hypothetical protein CCACVL1_07066 [Corchorus capsularis]|uniref:Uncharacterized protein n=1 Tax=Corchorus capsularis TaxID=210143 RepID=A0A1R3J9U3_COCAP|nr:hypothetical protein CCACVL1_07066 [Corchorus capsularis]